MRERKGERIMKNRKNTNKINTVWKIAVTVLLAMIVFGNGFSFRSILSMVGLSGNPSTVDMVAGKIDGGKILSSYSNPNTCTTTTIVEVEAAMSELGELITVSYDYEGIALESDCRRFLKWSIGFTRNSVEIDYEGCVKAGYDISEIKFEVDTENNVIRVTLSRPEIFSNEITATDVISEDNIFNHIDPDTATDLLMESKYEELVEAVDNGLYEQAEINAKIVIKNVISGICDCKIEFAEGPEPHNIDMLIKE